MSKEDIEEIVRDSGLWSLGSRSTHGFVLSPDVYRLEVAKAIELERLAGAIHDCLRGLSRIAHIASNSTLGTNHTWKQVASVCRAGVSKQYNEISFSHPELSPLTCKVDFLEGEDGTFYIVEIDAHNKHGMGYATLAARMRSALVDHTAVTFPGIAPMIASEMISRGHNELVLLWAKQEKFYIPEFHIFAQEMSRHGVKVLVVSETDLVGNRLKGFSSRAEDLEKYDFYVDIPTMYYDTLLRQNLIDYYIRCSPRLLIPPKPYLGSKGVLALLANETRDPEIEAILQSQIKAEALTLVRGHLPKTYLVTPWRSPDWTGILSQGTFVLKECISSGMKGVVFSDEPAFDTAFAHALRAKNHFVLQQEVTNKAETLRYFEEDGSVRSRSYFKRLTMHIVARMVAEVTVTARPDRKVHGNPDCLQLGTILEGAGFDPRNTKRVKILQSTEGIDL